MCLMTMFAFSASLLLSKALTARRSTVVQQSRYLSISHRFHNPTEAFSLVHRYLHTEDVHKILDLV